LENESVSLEELKKIGTRSENIIIISVTGVMLDYILLLFIRKKTLPFETLQHETT